MMQLLDHCWDTLPARKLKALEASVLKCKLVQSTFRELEARRPVAMHHSPFTAENCAIMVLFGAIKKRQWTMYRLVWQEKGVSIPCFSVIHEVLWALHHTASPTDHERITH